VFFIIALTILALIYGFTGWRLITPASIDPVWKVLAWVAVVVFFVLAPLPILLRFAGVEGRWVDRLSWIAYASLGFFLLLFVTLVVRDLLLLIGLAGKKTIDVIGRASQGPANPGSLLDPDRRRFLVNVSNLGALALVGSLSAYGFWESRRRPAVREITVPLRDLPDEFEGFRIAQITDVHLGPTIKRDSMQMVVDQTNALSADMIVVTGDLVDGPVAYLKDDAAPMAELAAPHGAYFITGNHEYYAGVLPWIDEVRRLGLTVLLNEHRVIERGSARMLLAGVTDYHGGNFIPGHRSDPVAAMSGAPPCNPKILLAHQPNSIFASSKAGYDLQITGHTHGGQFFPGNWLARMAQPYIRGLHKHGNTWIYVSCGTGYWGPPLRLGAPSEISVITLTRATVQPT
jgi:hypothetical protein